VIDPLIEPVPDFGQSLDDPHYAGRQHQAGMTRMRGNSARKNRIARVCKNSTKNIAGKKLASADQTVPAVRQKLHLSHRADFRDPF
jgi:hypothetical protein